jgi:uncharacterized protein (DUF2235 family)
MKNVVLCCDGTANEFARDRTNVLKLFHALQLNTPQQVAYYHPGLGTMELPGILTGFGKGITKLLGKAIGYGLEADVRDAYVFLMNNFEPDDRLFLFGFSRGAYTVRVVASLLHMYGLLPRGNEPLVPYAIRMFITTGREKFELANLFKDTFSRSCKPWFIGEWDTVGSIGWTDHQFFVPFIAYNPDIEFVRQAISIDEHRAFFPHNLWHPTESKASETPILVGPQDVKQVWFPGVHCDVGGGYPEAESGLSKIALEWMLGEAHAHHLVLNKARTDLVLGKKGGYYVPPDPTGQIHTSLTVVWWPAEFVFKKFYDWRTGKFGFRKNNFLRRTIPPGSCIHESAYKRGADYERCLPADAVRVMSLPLP